MPGGPEVLIIAAVLLLLFGGKKLPEMARGLGQAQREFREGLRDGAPSPTTNDPGASSGTPSNPV